MEEVKDMTTEARPVQVNITRSLEGELEIENVQEESDDDGGTDSFVYMEDVHKILDVAMVSQKNVILYGPGGYGKSEYTLEFFKENNIEPYVITMGTGMTTDRLFGGIDIMEFNKTGKLEYLVQNSFMNSEYVIFEELFDAPDFILEQLKDILSSGVFRNGTQMFPIKTKMIVCCTNKTREEFSKNISLKALMERFPLEMKVVWKDHNKITYDNLLVTKLGFSDDKLTFILENYASAGKIISPRIAITAAKIMAKCGPDALNFIADFSMHPDLLKSAIVKFDSISMANQVANSIKSLVEKYNSISLTTLENLREATIVNKEIFAEIARLKMIKVDDSLAAFNAEMIKTFTAIYDKNKIALERAVNVDCDFGLEKADDQAAEEVEEYEDGDDEYADL